MSESTNLMTEAASRLFADLCTKQALDAAENEFPAKLWAEVEAAGFPSMLADEAHGGSGVPPSDAVAVLREAGRASLPLPLGETMVARWVLSRCGQHAPEGPLALALGNTGKAWDLQGKAPAWVLNGHEDAVPWALDSAACVIVVPRSTGIAVAVVEPRSLNGERRRNIAGEPRDRIAAHKLALKQAHEANGLNLDDVLRMAALMRAGAITGALSHVLETCVRYTQERIQFGRPLSKFQAIQQQLAVLSGAAAAGTAITEAAAASAGRTDAALMVAAARARLADAIDTATGIAHQVHGAIGFAREYQLHYYTRRLWAWRDEFGTAVEWRERVGRAFVGTPADQLWPALAAVGSH